jgi:hypothetical protein
VTVGALLTLSRALRRQVLAALVLQSFQPPTRAPALASHLSARASAERLRAGKNEQLAGSSEHHGQADADNREASNH